MKQIRIVATASLLYLVLVFGGTTVMTAAAQRTDAERQVLALEESAKQDARQAKALEKIAQHLKKMARCK